jgi:aminopeptidase YwaD
MTGFGFSYLSRRLDELKLPPPRLAQREGVWGDGALYCYEALNLVDGRRSVAEVRDALAATYGPLPLAEVAEYLHTLQAIGVLSPR